MYWYLSGDLVMPSPEPSENVGGLSPEAGRPFTVVLAQQYFLERDALARVISIAQPSFITIDSTPEDVDEVIITTAPDVVICTVLTELTDALVPVWIQITMDDAAESVVSFHGNRTAVTHLGLNDILKTLVQAHSLRVFT